MAASFFATGKVTVVTSGTPVQIGALPAVVAGPLGVGGLSTVHAFVVQALSSNAGKIYIGLVGMSKATLAGVLVVLPVPTANLIPTFSVSLTEAANALSLNDLWFDADNSGEGVTISGVVA
jgi:hypothetical protein